MKLFNYKFLILGLIVLLQSCVTFDPSKTTTTDYIPVHPNPAVGDYAVRKMVVSDMEIKWEVVGVSADQITIKRTLLDSSLDMTNEYVVTREGRVLEAWVYYKGVKHPQKIVAPPEVGSMEKLEKLGKLPADKSIKTSAGSLEFSEAYTYEIRSSLLGSELTIRYVDFASEDVPFKVIERRGQWNLDEDDFWQAVEVFATAMESVETGDVSGLFDLNNRQTSGIEREYLKEFGFSQRR